MNTTSQDISPLLAALKREGLDTVYGAFAHKGGQELVKKGLGHRSRTRLSITRSTARPTWSPPTKATHATTMGSARRPEARSWISIPTRLPTGPTFRRRRPWDG